MNRSRLMFTAAVTLLFSLTALAQTDSAVRAGTQINAELQSTVDARTAKPNDQVVARVTKDVKQNGRTVVHKGDRLGGTVDSRRAARAGGPDERCGTGDHAGCRSRAHRLSASAGR